jgi:hypothetical protein
MRLFYLHHNFREQQDQQNASWLQERIKRWIKSVSLPLISGLMLATSFMEKMYHFHMYQKEEMQRYNCLDRFRFTQ